MKSCYDWWTQMVVGCKLWTKYVKISKAFFIQLFNRSAIAYISQKLKFTITSSLIIKSKSSFQFSLNVPTCTGFFTCSQVHYFLLGLAFCACNWELFPLSCYNVHVADAVFIYVCFLFMYVCWLFWFLNQMFIVDGVYSC